MSGAKIWTSGEAGLWEGESSTCRWATHPWRQCTGRNIGSTATKKGEREAGEGSSPGKRGNIDRNVREGAERIYRDYFSAAATYDNAHFERRYRMPRSVFDRIHIAVVERDGFFRERADATGKLGASSLQKLTAALRMLAYGASYDSLDEYCRISASSARMCMQRFCKAVCAIFGPEYLRMPTLNDLLRIQSASESKGFPGCIGSLDCMHWEWTNCPTT